VFPGAFGGNAKRYRTPRMVRRNRLRDLWEEDGTALGVIVMIPSVQRVQAQGQTRLDFIVIDLEHGPMEFGSAQARIAAWN
jgi:4-hydroxy-2-oxoheptanedioate aldolase